MKRFLITMVALAIITANSFAQVQSDIRTATLIHGDQTKVYYGVDAFKSAYQDAAEEGDVIVLSSGTFNQAGDITKSITIYGAGYETDPISGTEPTSIPSINIADKAAYDQEGNLYYVYPTVHLEGIHISNESLTIYNLAFYVKSSHGDATLENLVVRKCKILGNIALNPSTKNCLFSQCAIGNLGAYGTGRFDNGLYSSHSQLNIENCWVYYAAGSHLTSTINYDHCIIRDVYGGYANYTNSIIYSTLPENCTAQNNIFATTSIGTNVTGTGNWTGAADAGIWEVEGETGRSYAATKTFSLKFPAKYVGTDGTEVGINGGHAPFDRISPIPRILAADVDLRTAEDGKLNVNFKVEAQTKE